MPAQDALDPGALGDYPNLPRLESGELDVQRMPVGTRQHRGPDGVVRLIDVEPTLADGRRPSDIAPLPPAAT